MSAETTHDPASEAQGHDEALSALMRDAKTAEDREQLEMWHNEGLRLESKAKVANYIAGKATDRSQMLRPVVEGFIDSDGTVMTSKEVQHRVQTGVEDRYDK